VNTTQDAITAMRAVCDQLAEGSIQANEVHNYADDLARIQGYVQRASVLLQHKMVHLDVTGHVQLDDSRFYPDPVRLTLDALASAGRPSRDVQECFRHAAAVSSSISHKDAA
jgi:hypothetical protein